MSTFAELTDSILLDLSGYTADQDQATYLTAGIDSDDLTFMVADATSSSRGIVEIGDELIWVDSVDQSSLQAVVPPYGRGYRGSTAAAHAAGSKVASAPLFPRKSVKDAINATIDSLYPTLWGVGITTFTYSSGVYTYPMPADTIGVLAVTWQDYDVATEWNTVKRYDFNATADSTTFPTTCSITLGELIVPGRTVRVVYQKIPTRLSADADDFVNTTGLLSSVEDLIRDGAESRLIARVDATHMQVNSAEADFANQRVTNPAVGLSRYLFQRYQVGLQQEAERLNQMYPVRVRYTTS
mgnify:FL=1